MSLNGKDLLPFRLCLGEARLILLFWGAAVTSEVPDQGAAFTALPEIRVCEMEINSLRYALLQL